MEGVRKGIRERGADADTSKSEQGVDDAVKIIGSRLLLAMALLYTVPWDTQQTSTNNHR